MKKFFLPSRIVLAISICLLLLPLLTSARKSNPGMTDTITFRVDMKYMIIDGTFNPLTDTAGMIISHGQWHETCFLERIGTSDVYEIRKELNLGVIYSFKFRIHQQDTVINEQTDAFTRMVRTPDTAITITRFFNNINPATVPMTFNCNMYYQIHAGHFVPNTDFVDVAGNFNNESANDVLFIDGYDSLFKVTLFMDTALIGGPPLQFKFRVNGNWQTSELQGDSGRTYTLTGTNDSFTAWYNNIDPTMPALPFVYDLLIQDTLYPKRTVTGSYRYEDYNLRPEGNSRYRWYTADSIGGAVTMIDSAFSISYTIDSVYLGKYLAFEVMPLTRDSVAGLPVLVYSQTPIFGVGIYEKSLPLVRIFPNPCNENLYVEPLTGLETISLFNLTGQLILSIEDFSDSVIRIDVRNLKKGVYVLLATSKDSRNGRYKIIVQ